MFYFLRSYTFKKLCNNWRVNIDIHILYVYNRNTKQEVLSMKKIKVLTSVLLCICMLFSFCSIASAASAKLTYSYSGSTATVKDCNTDASGTVKIPAKVTYNSKEYTVKIIGQDAFADCKSIKTINIPNGVTAIKSGAFSNCTSLKNVYIPETVVSCAYDAFDGCEKVTVHCYTSNYQFFSVLGFSDNIVIEVLDESKVDTEPVYDESDSLINNVAGLISGIISGGSFDIEGILGGLTSGEGDFVEINTAKDTLVKIIITLVDAIRNMMETFLGK